MKDWLETLSENQDCLESKQNPTSPCTLFVMQRMNQNGHGAGFTVSAVLALNLH
ncbi:MAG: hypothetical protein QOK48_637 [Blastocatellia bacterium]|jgi:hypothetical protein|nr:hypothetical protein [Blastocatellia bacterium]